MPGKYFSVIFMILLAAAVALVALSRKNKSLQESMEDLIPPDIGQINRISILYEKDHLLLERSGDTWYINQSGHARPERIELILSGLRRLEMVAPVSKLAREDVAALLAEKGRRVQLYQRGRLVRSFYAYYDSLHVNGTCLMKYPSGIPLVVKFRGYPAGNIMELFSTEVNDYAEDMLFGYSAAEILEITVLYPDEPDKSYSISKNHRGELVLANPANRQIIQDANQQELSDYLHFFGPVTFDHSATVQPDHFASQQPFATVTISVEKGPGTDLKAYRYQLPSGKRGDFDRYRYIAAISNRKDTVLIRYSDTDPVFRQAGDFQKK